VDFIETRRETLREAFQVAREQLGERAVRRKRQYDLRVKPASYTVGDKVWCLVPRRRQGRYPKWTSPYQGPFTVIAVLGPVTYRVQRQGRGRPWTIHVDKLKHCYEQEGIRDDNPSVPLAADTEQQTVDSPSPRPRRNIPTPARFLY